MTASIQGGAIGLVLALGLLVAVRSAPPLRAISLEQRLAPYLRDTPRPSRLLASDRLPAPYAVSALRQLLSPILGDVVSLLDRLVGGRNAVRRRLAALGSAQTVEDFRVEQVLCGMVGLGGGIAATVLLSLPSGGATLVSTSLLCIVGILAGVLGRDWALSRRVRRRRQVMLAEFPLVAELLALAVTAGEGPVGAIERVCRLTGGEIGRDLSDVLARARAGASLVRALEELRDRSALEPLVRFVDGVIVAIERGTPLAEVLRAQAADSRESTKRALIEAGGRREIGMMVPVVFLILPVTVLFALFPGLVNITEIAR
jgi:tight adherence protein C